MLDNTDELIMKLKNKKASISKNRKMNLNDYIKINGENYIFEKKTIFRGKLSIIFPNGFLPMEVKSINLKYPSAQRPQIIFTNKDNTINFTFTEIPGDYDNEDADIIKDNIISAIKETNPAVLFYEENIITAESLKIYIFDFKSYSLSGHIYNLMYVFSLGSSVILGNLNCYFDLYEEWRPVMFAIIQSIKSENKEGQNERDTDKNISF